MTEILQMPEVLAAPSRPRYLPIAEHGVIGDLHTVALVGTDGHDRLVLLPRFDSPSVFGAILDEEQGRLLPDRARRPTAGRPSSSTSRTRTS